MTTKATARPVQVYGIKNCDTMKKALAWLVAQGVAHEFVDYKKAGVVEAHLGEWMTQAGWETLLNRRGLMWRKLAEEERADVDAAKAARLMRQYPALIKRPVLVMGERVVVGFSEAGYADLFEEKGR